MRWNDKTVSLTSFAVELQLWLGQMGGVNFGGGFSRNLPEENE